MNQYGQMRKFMQRINSVLDQQKSKKSAPRSTKGLLARQNYTESKPEVGDTDFTKRVANYVSVIRKQRAQLNAKQNQEKEVIE
jgi:hypothetical protein